MTRPRRRVLTSTGRLLVIFAAGSVGTVVGTLVAAKVMPLQTLGSDAWKVLAFAVLTHHDASAGYVAGAFLLSTRIIVRMLRPVDSAQIAAALAARHIGGAVNYVAVAEATAMTPSAQAAGLAADNLVSAAHP